MKESVTPRRYYVKTMAKAARVRHSKTKLHIICDIKKFAVLWEIRGSLTL